MKKFMLIAAALAVLFLSACFSRPYPGKNYYSLMAEASMMAERAPKIRPRTLILGQAAAAAGFEERFLIYRTGPNRFEADFYNELVAAPARLLADMAAQHLDNINPRLRVLKNPGLLSADFGLEIYLMGFYGDFTGEKPNAAVDIRFTVSDLRSSQAGVILDKTYHRKSPLADKSPAALAAGLGLCASEILTELNRDLEKIPL